MTLLQRESEREGELSALGSVGTRGLVTEGLLETTVISF